MKKHLLLVILGLNLLACQKDDDSSPLPVTSDFDQYFTLYYRQQAALPSSTQSELTVAVTELAYSICPKNANCFAADFAVPTLRITDAQGQTQQLKIPANGFGRRSPDWIDTASVRANGRRYLLTYVDWKVKGDYHAASKETIAVGLRVTKPN